MQNMPPQMVNAIKMKVSQQQLKSFVEDGGLDLNVNSNDDGSFDFVQNVILNESGSNGGHQVFQNVLNGNDVVLDVNNGGNDVVLDVNNVSNEVIQNVLNEYGSRGSHQVFQNVMMNNISNEVIQLLTVDPVSNQFLPISSNRNDSENSDEESVDENMVEIGKLSEEKKREILNIKRPPNQYFIYCEEQRIITKKENTDLAPREITSLMSKKWKAMSDEEKKKYKDMADEKKRLFLEKYPNWKNIQKQKN